MSDVDDITALVNSYARLLDEGDIDAVADLFAQSTWRSEPPGSVLRGRDEVRPVYERLLASAGGNRTKHLLTNLTVQVDRGRTHATAHWHWTVLQRSDPRTPIGIILTGRYLDSFEKVDGTWR